MSVLPPNLRRLHFSKSSRNRQKQSPLCLKHLNGMQKRAVLSLVVLTNQLKQKKQRYDEGGMSITRKRNKRIVFYLDDAELALLDEKMAAAKIGNREAYLRKMSLDGYIVRIDFSDVREMVRLLRNATNNLNQVARRANETRSIYASDITDLQDNYEKLWQSAEVILNKLAKM